MIFIDIKTTYQFDQEQIDPKKLAILGIGVKIGDEIKIWDGEMLAEFIEWFSTEPDKIIVGFNILKYDIPLLLLKASSVNATEKLYNKIFRSNIVDLFVILTFLNKGKFEPLKWWCEKLNVLTPSINHSQKIIISLSNLSKHHFLLPPLKTTIFNCI